MKRLALILGLAALGALGSAGRSIASTGVAEAAQNVPVRGEVLSAGSSVQPTPQQISQAKAAYAKLSATVMQNLQTADALGAEIANADQSCAENPNPECLDELQVWTDQYNTLLTEFSSVIETLSQVAQNAYRNLGAEAARTVMSVRGTVSSVRPSVQPTPREISQAKAPDAKLRATVKQEIRKLKARYAKLLSRAKSCAQRATGRCTLAIQLAVKIVRTFGNTMSRVTRELSNLIQSFNPRPKPRSGSRYTSARSVSRAPAQLGDRP